MSKKKLRISFIILCVVFLAGLGAFAYIQYDQLSQVQWQASAQKESMVKLKTDIARLEKSVEWYQKEQNDYFKFFLKQEDVSRYIKDISAYAQQSSITVVDIKPLPHYPMNLPRDMADPQEGKFSLNRKPAQSIHNDESGKGLELSAVPIDLHIKGDFASLVRFLNHLQDQNQRLHIVKLNIQRIAEYPVLDCQVTVRLFGLKIWEE